ncbi:MAG: hypothetical protein IPJ81_11845 [Chitinophagaceae bacterium]|jgi:hypothetical protein|nr:hypothetical protein [Chitinophagaceae bacterium]
MKPVKNFKSIATLKNQLSTKSNNFNTKSIIGGGGIIISGSTSTAATYKGRFYVGF